MTKTKTTLEQFISDDEGHRLFEQERAILEVTELICKLMAEQGINRAELARRLGKSKAYISALLDGMTNMTIRTISDVMGVLGSSFHVSEALPIQECLVDPEMMSLAHNGEVIYTIDFDPEADLANGGYNFGSHSRHVRPALPSTTIGAKVG